ncbi:MAG: LysM peptidoglycan-binding domain-containing protein [Anaerolineaceae bacterium]
MPSVQRCPLLGLKDDDQSRLAFASESHACYRSGKGKPISIAHQREFCLEKEHITCPIFINAGLNPPKPIAVIPPKLKTEEQAVVAATTQVDEKDEIPEEFSEEPGLQPRFAHIWEIAGVAIFAIILLVGWWLFNNRDLFFPNHTPVQAFIAKTAQISPTVTSTDIFVPNAAHVLALTTTPIVTDPSGVVVTPSFTILPSVTATVTITRTRTRTVSPSPSTSPSRTPTPDLPGSTASTSCSLPGGWTTYTIVSGDTLFYFANVFNTTVDAIMQANCLTSTTIYPGQSIFLPGIPRSSTATFTPTPTREEAHRTNNRTPTRTFTSTFTFTPLSTLTYTPSNTPSPTNIPPTATHTPTNITQTATPTPTETFTPLPPTDTPFPSTSTTP